ncbi:DUF5983 family protein [Sphingomonas koreensis]
MEFGKYVVLSTAHVRCATAERLTAWAKLPPELQPIAVAPTSYGWFLPTHSVSDAEELPEELPAILAFGRDRGCDHVLLDSDGEEVAELPVFPW